MTRGAAKYPYTLVFRPAALPMKLRRQHCNGVPGDMKAFCEVVGGVRTTGPGGRIFVIDEQGTHKRQARDIAFAMPNWQSDSVTSARLMPKRHVRWAMAEQRHDGCDQIHESRIAVREFNTFDVRVPSKKRLCSAMIA